MIAGSGRFDDPEMQAAQPMLQAQARLSRLPSPGRLLAGSEGEPRPAEGRDAARAHERAARALRRSPGFTLSAVAVLALRRCVALGVHPAERLYRAASDVERLLTDLCDAAHLHVLDLSGRQVLRAPHDDVDAGGRRSTRDARGQVVAVAAAGVLRRRL